MAYSWQRVTPPEKRAILEAIRGGPAPPPRVVEISWQDRCNIDCFFCSTAEMRAGNSALPAERLLPLFDELAALGVRAVRLTGGGEPLFRRDAADLIREIGRRGMRISDVTTNAVLLTEPVLRALYETGCDELHVSINTAEAASYAAMMQTSARNFDRVVENVKLAARLKRETRADCAIRLQFLVYRDNYRQIPRMHALFRETGADRFWFNGLFPVRPMPAMSGAEIAEMLELYESVLADDLFERLTGFSFWERDVSERIAQATRRALARAPLSRRIAARARRAARGDRESPSLAALHEFCLVGWYSTAVNANGDVVACCILQDRKSAVLGNLHGATLSEIWNGAAYERFRGELRAIMAARGAVLPPGACVVEDVCVKKGDCPNRSFYWAADAPFRKKFHRIVDAMPAPESGPRPSAGDRTIR
jgi:molybdenum cofactor biosynthesis enzyme MoaA